MSCVAVLGAGNSGLAMAGHFVSSGEEVRLWSRDEDHSLAPITASGGITLSGELNGRFLPRRITAELHDAVQDAELIMVAVPASGHADVLRQLAPHLVDGQMIVLNPGRTGGALVGTRILRETGCGARVVVAETQTIAYTCRKTSAHSCEVLSFKNRVELAALPPAATPMVLSSLPACLRARFLPSNTIRTSLGNVGMILHCAPMLLNVGWIETQHTHFKYYYEAITPSVAAFLERLDEERCAVAAALGEEIPGVNEWLGHSYGVSGHDLHECIRNNTAYAHIDAPATLEHRYLSEDIPTGAVPLEAIGSVVGLSLPFTKIVLDLAEKLLRRSFRELGRNADCLGLRSARNKADVRSILLGDSLF